MNIADGLLAIASACGSRVHNHVKSAEVTASISFMASPDLPQREWGCRGGHHVDTTPQTTKAALRRPLRKPMISFGEFGAGEGIRTLDPNLGKVVLYP